MFERWHALTGQQEASGNVVQVAEPRRAESDYCASKTVRTGQATGYRQDKVSNLVYTSV